MKKYQTSQIRNVALVSHGGAGKTSIGEAMLYSAGAVNRLGNTDAGTTTSDYDPEEVKRKISINTATIPLEWSNSKINILDTPGYFDFIGEVLGALRVADAAVVNVCAASGIEVGTEKVWAFAEERNMPRLVFVNKLDRENANFYKTVEHIQEFFGINVVPIALPIGSEENLKGVVDLVKMKAYIYTSDTGRDIKEEEIPGDLQDKAQEYREKLIEVVAESDDALLEKYLEGEDLSDEEVTEGLKKAVQQQEIFPILCGSAVNNIGITVLLDYIVSCLPSPADIGAVQALNAENEEEIEIRIDSKGSLTALVFKTLADPYVGKVSFFKVMSGVFKGDAQPYNVNKDTNERIGQVFLMRGKNQINVKELEAGDIGAVAKLQETATGDTLCENKNQLIKFPTIKFPNPVISFAVRPKSKGDEEKVGSGLARFTEEDPTFKVERNTETKQTLISGMGDMHLDIIVNKLLKKFNVDVELSTPIVPYKETIRTSTKSEYKHKKQSGGRGQYGHVYIEIEPLAAENFVFEEKIFGGAVPRQYFGAVEKGIREALENGSVAGYPVVNVKATLYDGTYHNVDSSEMAFKIAASTAFKRGMLNANPVLLEPIMDTEIKVPEAYMGDIMGDLNSRRGKIQGMDSEQGFQIIKAKVPLAEMFKYSIDLRSMTQGRGFFSMEHSHYEEVPQHISEKIIADSKIEEEE